MRKYKTLIAYIWVCDIYKEENNIIFYKNCQDGIKSTRCHTVISNISLWDTHAKVLHHTASMGIAGGRRSYSHTTSREMISFYRCHPYIECATILSDTEQSTQSKLYTN